MQRELVAIFRLSGLPRRMLMDNGPPWGDIADQPWTRLTAWLVRLGIRVTDTTTQNLSTQYEYVSPFDVGATSLARCPGCRLDFVLR